MNPDDRKAAEAEHQKNLEKRKHHEKVNEPGSKDQLEEVWEEEDDLKGNKFDPKTFFALHGQNSSFEQKNIIFLNTKITLLDTDSNGFLDEFEVEALFQRELDKIFNATDPEYDPVERDEEMNRMREHVFKEMDKDHDRLISMDEFIQTTHEKQFEKNEEWKVSLSIVQSYIINNYK